MAYDPFSGLTPFLGHNSARSRQGKNVEKGSDQSGSEDIETQEFLSGPMHGPDFPREKAQDLIRRAAVRVGIRHRIAGFLPARVDDASRPNPYPPCPADDPDTNLSTDAVPKSERSAG
jgi:hypothetical protein